MMQVLYHIPIKFWPFTDGIWIYGFGMMLFLAFICCTWLAGRRAEYEGISKETIQDLAIILFVTGLIGARITYLMSEPWPGLLNFIILLPQIWKGGIVLYGSIIGGVVGYFIARYVYFWWWRGEVIPTRRLIDAIAPSIALGLCLGRIGCLLNGCCYGLVACSSCPAVTPITFPQSAPPRDALVHQGYQTLAGFTVEYGASGEGVQVAAVDPGSPAYAAGLRPGSIIVGVNGESISNRLELAAFLTNPRSRQQGDPRVILEFKPTAKAEAETHTLLPRTLGLYPTQIYESISMFLLMLVLLAYTPYRHNPGQVCAVLMGAYGIHRFLNELLRDDPRPVGLESYGSIFLVVTGLLMWLWLWRMPAEGPAIPVGDAAKAMGRPAVQG